MIAIRNWSFINFPAASEISLPYTKCTPGLWQSSNLLSSFLSCSKRDVPEEEKTFSAPVKFFPLLHLFVCFLVGSFAETRRAAQSAARTLAASGARGLEDGKTAAVCHGRGSGWNNMAAAECCPHSLIRQEVRSCLLTWMKLFVGRLSAGSRAFQGAGLSLSEGWKGGRDRV